MNVLLWTHDFQQFQQLLPKLNVICFHRFHHFLIQETAIFIIIIKLFGVYSYMYFDHVL